MSASDKDRPTVTEQQVIAALSKVDDPELNRDLVSLGMVRDVEIDGGHVSFTVVLTTPACPVKEQMKSQADAAVRAIPGVTDVTIECEVAVFCELRFKTGKARITSDDHFLFKIPVPVEGPCADCFFHNF